MGRVYPARLRGSDDEPLELRFVSRRPEQASLKQRNKEICKTRVRDGYRRIHVRGSN